MDLISFLSISFSVEGLRSKLHHTFCPQILCPLHFIHGLERLLLFSLKSLLVIVFSGAPDPVEEDAARRCVFEEVDDEEDEGDYDGRPKGRQQSNYNAI